MDVSLLFKACVKTVSLYDKPTRTYAAININNLEIRKKQDSFFIKAQVITNQIMELYELLLGNRQAYLNFLNYLPSKARLTDDERDQIDSVVQNTVSNCSKLIKDLKRDIATSNTSPQNQEHCEIIVLLIQEYLKHVCKMYSENKTIRVKKAIELRKISKLQPLRKQKYGNYSHQTSNVNFMNNLEENTNANDDSFKVQELNGDLSNTLYSEDEQISSEDFQMLEAENEQLYNNLNTSTEEIQQIETKVVHITELQEIFTEKVLNQDKNIERVLTTVVGSTENVKEANEQIRQAIQRNAGLRVWILFFLLVLSFTLLFVDWYNP